MKLLTIFWLSLLASHAKPAPVQAQADTVKLQSYQQVIAAAVKNNPTQAVYQQQIKQAQYNYKASKGFIYPNASANFNGTDNLHLAVTPIPGILLGQPGTTYYAQFGKQFIYNTGVTLTEDIFDWTSILQSQIASNNIRLNQLQQDSYLQNLRDQAGKYYFSALIAKSALKIISTDRLLADSIVALTKQRLKEGTTDLLAVNQATINTTNIQQNQAQSQQLYDQSIENLKILLGEQPANELALAETLNLDSLISVGMPTLGYDKNLDVYQQQISIADLQSRSQRSAAYPKLSASAYFGAQQFRNDFGLSFGNNAWSAYRYLGLNLTVPVFTGFTNSNKYKSALVQKNIAQLQYNNARQQSEINDRLLLKSYADYLHMAQAAATSFKLYGNNLKLNQQKYQEGILSMDIYLRAFQDYLTAENAYLNSLSQLLSTRSTLLSRQ